MIVAMMESAHPEIAEREHFLNVRIGTIDEETVVDAEVDGDNRLRIVMKKYTNAEWDETRHRTEMFVGEKGTEIIHPMGFCLNCKQRDTLISIFNDEQWYGMKGWDYTLSYYRYMCEKRGINASNLKRPDFSDFPALEDGNRGIYDRWYYGPETRCVLCSLLNTPLGKNTFAFVMVNEEFKPEKAYMKICEFVEPCMGHEYLGVGMDVPEIHYDINNNDEIRRWCRVSLKQPEYLMIGDECMMLDDSQKRMLNHAVRKEWGEIVRDVNRCVSSGNGEEEYIHMDWIIPDYNLLPTIEEER